MVYNYPEKGYTRKTQTERGVYTEREKKNKGESWHKRRVKKEKRRKRKEEKINKKEKKRAAARSAAALTA